MTGLYTQQNLSQKQILSQRQLLSLNILAMNNQILSEFLGDEFLDNPLIENLGVKTADEQPSLEYWCEHSDIHRENDSGWYDDDNNRTSDIPAVSKFEISEYLLSQLNRRSYTQNQWSLFTLLCECLDESGFLTLDCDEITQFAAFSAQQVKQGVEILSQLEPCGIFSRNLSECLLKQIEAQGISDRNLTEIVKHHLPDIAEGHIGKISRALKLSSTDVRRYIRALSKLKPRPLHGFSLGKTEYIVPDVLAYCTSDKGASSEWDISLNDGWIGEYKFNDYYINMMKNCNDEELYQYFKKKLEHGRFILNCVEQRRKTLLAITESIVDRQWGFFLRGEQLRPMTMDDVAVGAKIHVSTVSRAIKDKYINGSCGTLLMKSLFSAQVSAASGGDFSAVHVKEIIKGLVGTENPARPYSDMALSKLLKEKSIAISRRTVAKYRAELDIPDSNMRRYV